ncbi:MAG: hypothetical protein K6G24_13315 [Lachnospiraceae bacterium]|nr:hypothetical protein [Lachnospiraceae bacterium]
MKIFFKYLIMTLVFMLNLLGNNWHSAFAKDSYTGISGVELEKIVSFVQSDEMISELSLALNEEIDRNEVYCSECFMVNVLQGDFYKLWDMTESIKTIYGEVWQYKVPLVIRNKKTVITLLRNGDKYECIGISYGDANSIYFLNESDIEKTVQEAGISVDSIDYSDVLMAYSVNTLFVHISISGKDYLIPFTAVDLSEYSDYEDDMYKSGEMYTIATVIEKLRNSSLAYNDDNSGDIETVPLGGGSLNENTMDVSNKAVLEKNVRTKTIFIGGIIVTGSLIAALVLLKRQSK